MVKEITQKQIEETAYIKWLQAEKDYDIDTISRITGIDADVVNILTQSKKLEYNPQHESLCIFCTKCCNERLCNKNPKEPITDCEDFERGRSTGQEIETEGAIRLLETILESIYATYTNLKRIGDDNGADSLKRRVCSANLFKMCGITSSTFNSAYEKYKAKNDINEWV